MARRIAPVHSTEEIRLAEAATRTPRLARLFRRRSETDGGHSGYASLLVSARALRIEAPATFRGKLEVPLESIRRAVVDDGGGWAYTTATCRFPVYDRRAGGSGTGALVGPLWSTSPGLLPEGCPVLALEPVPAQAPNIALIFDPCVTAPLSREHDAANPPGPGSIAAMLLCAEDPEAARETLAARLEVGDLDLDDLDYLNHPTRPALDLSGGEASAASA